MRCERPAGPAWLLAALAIAGCRTGVPGSAPAAPDTADEGAPASAPIGRAPVRVEVPLRGEDLHLEIDGIRFASTLDAGPPKSVECTIRLCRGDGRDAGPARKGVDGRHPWPRTFTHGTEARLLFRRESDGMFWEVVVVPAFEADGEVRWTVARAGLL